MTYMASARLRGAPFHLLRRATSHRPLPLLYNRLSMKRRSRLTPPAVFTLEKTATDSPLR